MEEGVKKEKMGLHNQCLVTQWEKNLFLRLENSTEIGKKAWLFAKLQPGRARKRINAT